MENRKNLISIEGVQVFVVYMFRAKKLMPLKSWEHMEISLEPCNFELLTVSPMKLLSSKI
uniref:Uncharacterized protein n=1 Tax=Nelumbo nucifera TaxID=4432 RepID=A0A822ZRR4_NELNU|nr:TPA_asm: hypothetical protein HUJ06_017879 [Nelumbo nucifera]